MRGGWAAAAVAGRVEGEGGGDQEVISEVQSNFSIRLHCVSCLFFPRRFVFCTSLLIDSFVHRFYVHYSTMNAFRFDIVRC